MSNACGATTGAVALMVLMVVAHIEVGKPIAVAMDLLVITLALAVVVDLSMVSGHDIMLNYILKVYLRFYLCCVWYTVLKY